MLDRDRFEILKHKSKPSLQDFALLIVTVERLFRTNDDQAEELKKCLKSLDTLNSRLKWYRNTTMKKL